MYYRKCPYCGANLDPDERCDCHEDEQEKEATPPPRNKPQMKTTTIILAAQILCVKGAA